MSKTDRQFMVLCVGIVLAALVCTWPVAESGVIDDWSYAKTAQVLAQTGHLTYNGWGGAIVGVQAYWGALFIRLFGFSFLVVRLSNVPSAVGCVVLLYLLNRKAGLAPALACFGTLAVALSPLFIGVAATFMTDVPALFFLLLSVYGYTHLAERLDSDGSPWQPELWAWAAVGVGAGVLGGTVRQFVWFVPLTSSAYLFVRAWVNGRLTRAFLPLVASCLVTLDLAMELVAWFNMQPYALPLGSNYSDNAWSRVGFEAACALQTLGWMLLPVLVLIPLLVRLRIAEHRWRFGAAGAACAMVVWLAMCWCYGGIQFFEFLSGACVGMSRGIPGRAPMPISSVVLDAPQAVWHGMSVLVTVLVCMTLALALVSLWWSSRLRYEYPIVVRVAALFYLTYAALILIQSVKLMSSGMMDRYLLELLAPCVMVTLGVYQQWLGRVRVPVTAWAVVALLAFYGVARSHDNFSELRARCTVTLALEQQGIPRNHILAGVEYDCWTQIGIMGYCNARPIKVPWRVFHPTMHLGFDTFYLSQELVPAVHPYYVVAWAPHPDLRMADMPPCPYTCWIPPFQRSLFVQLGPFAAKR